MALVPRTERGRLEGLELPDAEGWDRLHALDGQLVAHHREEAEQVFAQMQKRRRDTS